MVLKFNRNIKSKKSKRHWLIDSENTADRWVCDMLFSKEMKRDKVTVFYTKNTCNMKYETVKLLRETRKPKIEWIECFTGSNALDFQLVSQLGVYIAARPNYEYIILSNDTGYDAVVKYWRKQGRRIIRLNTAAVRSRTKGEDSGKNPKKEKKDRKENGSQPGRGGLKSERGSLLPKNRRKEDGKKQIKSQPPAQPAKTEQGQATEASQEDTLRISAVTQRQRLLEEKLLEACGQDKQVPERVMELAKSISIKNKSMLNTACCAMFGQETGGGVYRCIKENEEFHDLLKAQHLSSRKERASAYMTLMLELSGYKDEEIERLAEIGYKAPKNNLSNLNRFLVKALGQDEGMAFYHIIKPHLAVLRKL